jgi:hypothetical protein
MVRKKGLEPSRLSAQPPQGCVSTSFTICALLLNIHSLTLFDIK